MTRPAVALVVGFTRRPGLPGRSFAPLLRLKQAGMIGRIVYVTWDRPDLDPFVADAAALRDVELVRVPEPVVTGLPYQKKHFYQTANLRAALALVPDGDTLVVKLRPDVVIDADFLAAKIAGFERLCAPSRLAARFDAALPASPFARKVWIPWADANQPFFFEDGIFMGLRRDVARLAEPASDEIARRFGDANSAWIVHVARYIAPFLGDYPIFKAYLRRFHLFVQRNDYRHDVIAQTGGTAFFWTLAIANAWILANNFHVDCGGQDTIVFPPPEDVAPPQEPAPLSREPVSRAPYNDVEMWRRGQRPGGFLDCARRIYGRLVDDSWQQALFTQPLSDLPADNLLGVLRCIGLYRHGLLDEAEDEFYRKVETVYRRHGLDGRVMPAA